MTKDEEIEILNRRVKAWQRMRRALMREVEELRVSNDLLTMSIDKKNVAINQYEEECKRYHKRIDDHEEQLLLIYQLLCALGPCDQRQSLYANVAAALARAALGKRG